MEKEEVDETRELTGGWLEEFSEPCPCQSQGKSGGLIFWCAFPSAPVSFKFSSLAMVSRV